MTRSQLHRAVARATGDDCAVITRRGFSLVDEESPLRDDDIEALIADWDQIEAEEITSPCRHDMGSLASNRISMSRAAKSRVRRSATLARVSARVRRALGTEY